MIQHDGISNLIPFGHGGTFSRQQIERSNARVAGVGSVGDTFWVKLNGFCVLRCVLPLSHVMNHKRPSPPLRDHSLLRAVRRALVFDEELSHSPDLFPLPPLMSS